MFKNKMVLEKIEVKPNVKLITKPRQVKWDEASFVKFWLQARNVGEVARHFNVSESVASQKASHLRHVGVKLPLKRNHGNKVDQLNKLIKEYTKGN